jgi:tetratricopeptide (TPR) repeat protein
VPALLRDIYASRRSGTLRLARGREHCAIRFVKGHIVYGAASEKHLHMGEVMVNEGLLSPEHLQRATEIVREQHKRLGEALKSLGVVDEELLEEFLAIHVRMILVHAFSWKDGEYAFDEQDPELQLEHDFPLKMSTGEVIMEAARRVEDRASVLFSLGSLERIVLPSANPLVLFQRINLTPIDGFVQSRVDGTSSLREIVEITPLEAEAVEKSLFALLATGLLELAPDRPKQETRSSAQILRQELLDAHARLAESNHFERLGLDPKATDAEIKAAFLRLAKRYHPDVHHDPALADLRDKIEAVFEALSEAHRVLSDPRARQAYRALIDPTAPPAPPEPPEIVSQAVQAVDATQLFQTADDKFQEGKYWEAVALLGETVKVAQGRLLQRARVLLARAYLMHPDTEKQAEKELQAVLQDDLEYVDAYFYLGKVYKRGGLTARARGMLNKALELRPHHREALAELDALGPKPEPGSESEQTGFLKRILGKDQG